MPPDLQLLHPERAAHATIRGFLYQTCLGVLRWLDLAPEEVLVCEGDEDLDRLIRGGGGISEQVKAYSGSLGLGHRAVSDSLRNFFLAYVALRRRGEDRRFRFITTARLKRQRGGERLDVLREWQAGERGTELVGAVKALLAQFDPPGTGRWRSAGWRWRRALPGSTPPRRDGEGSWMPSSGASTLQTWWGCARRSGTASRCGRVRGTFLATPWSTA